MRLLVREVGGRALVPGLGVLGRDHEESQERRKEE